MALRARRSSARASLGAPVAPLLLALAVGPAGCALGEEEEPGCRRDADCEPAFVCRAGACFAITTGLSPPLAPDAGHEDAGDGGVPDSD